MIGTSRIQPNHTILLPKHPVAGWAAISGAQRSSLQCLLDAPQLQFTTSGRAALLHALIRLGVGKGDLVLVPTYHCPSMVAPIAALGAQPVFYPITVGGGVDLAVIRGWLGEMRPRAIIAAHFFGLPQPMTALRALCDESGMALIEDCAHSLFGSSDGRPVGQWGDFAIGSLTKFLAVPEGGCLISKGSSGAPIHLEPRGFVEQIRAAVDVVETGAQYGRFQGINWLLAGVFRLKRRFLKGNSDALAVQESPDVAGAPDAYLSLDTALANKRLAAVCGWIARRAPKARVVAIRRRNYQMLANAFQGSRTMRPLMPVLPDQSAPYVFPLWVENPDPAYKLLRQRGFPLFRWDWLWPGTPAIAGDFGLEWSNHVFQIVCHQDLREHEISAMVESLREICC